VYSVEQYCSGCVLNQKSERSRFEDEIDPVQSDDEKERVR